MPKEPTCLLCGGPLVQESHVAVMWALPLRFDLAWVCAYCSAAYPIAVGKGNLRIPCEPLYRGGKRTDDRGGEGASSGPGE
jgi:hypothetical protein